MAAAVTPVSVLCKRRERRTIKRSIHTAPYTRRYCVDIFPSSGIVIVVIVCAPSRLYTHARATHTHYPRVRMGFEPIARVPHHQQPNRAGAAVSNVHIVSTVTKWNAPTPSSKGSVQSICKENPKIAMAEGRGLGGSVSGGGGVGSSCSKEAEKHFSHPRLRNSMEILSSVCVHASTVGVPRPEEGMRCSSRSARVKRMSIRAPAR